MALLLENYRFKHLGTQSTLPMSIQPLVYLMADPDEGTFHLNIKLMSSSTAFGVPVHGM